MRAVPLLDLVLSLCMCAWAWASRRRAPCWGASRGVRRSSSFFKKRPCPYSTCARGLGPRDDGRLAGVRAEVRAVPLLGLVLSLCMCAWAWASRRRAPCWGASRGARGSSSWPCPRSACARGLGPRDDSRLAGVRAEVRGPRDGIRPVGARLFEFHEFLPGLALALFLFILALLVHVHVCVGLETAGALVLPSLCFCFLWLPLCTCAAWAWASRGRARGASRVARGYS